MGLFIDSQNVDIIYYATNNFFVNDSAADFKLHYAMLIVIIGLHILLHDASES